MTPLRRLNAALFILCFSVAFSAVAAQAESPDRIKAKYSDPFFSVLLVNGETLNAQLGAFDSQSLLLAPTDPTGQPRAIPTPDVLAVRQTPPRNEIDNFARNAKRMTYQTLSLDGGQVVFARSIRIDFKSQIVFAEPLFDKELSLSFPLSMTDAIHQTETAPSSPPADPSLVPNATEPDGAAREDDVMLLKDGRLIACELVALSSAGDVRYKTGQAETSVPYKDIVSVKLMRAPSRALPRPSPSAGAATPTPSGNVRVRFIDATELDMTLPTPGAETIAPESPTARVRLLYGGRSLDVRWTAIHSIAHLGAAVQPLTSLDPLRSDYRPTVAADGLPALFEPRVNRSLFGREYPNRLDAIFRGVAFASSSETSVRADSLYETISMRSTTTMTWSIPETATFFVTDALIEPDVETDGEAVCEVLLDYRPVETATLTSGGRGRRFSIDVRDRRFLSLVVRRGNDGDETGDHIVWRFPRFILSAESRR